MGFLLAIINDLKHSFNTLLLLFFISVCGIWLSNRTANYLGDRRLRILSTFWLIKIIATLFLLFVGWMPQLDPSSPLWGYDPQRYYQYGWDLVQRGWNPFGLEQNYQGIIFYYGAIFFIFGHNPVNPALINAFVTLLGTLFLIRCIYEFMPNRMPADWRIAYLLLIPEVLWFDVITSRETLMGVLIIIATLTAGRYLVSKGCASLKTSVALVGIALVAIATVRTTMVIPVLAAIIFMAMLFKSQGLMSLIIKILLVLLGVGALMGGPIIQRMMGGYDIDLSAIPTRLLGHEGIRAEDEWGDKSIGLLLMPSGPLQSLAYTFPRMILYLAAPLPRFDNLSLLDLYLGSWSAWQHLMTITTSLMMVFIFPYVLSASEMAWRGRKINPAALIIPISFWLNFAVIAGGVTIIQERYRVMITLLLFACAWIGYTRSPQKINRRWVRLWFTIILVVIVFYLYYKFL